MNLTAAQHPSLPHCIKVERCIHNWNELNSLVSLRNVVRMKTVWANKYLSLKEFLQLKFLFWKKKYWNHNVMNKTTSVALYRHYKCQWFEHTQRGAFHSCLSHLSQFQHLVKWRTKPGKSRPLLMRRAYTSERYFSFTPVVKPWRRRRWMWEGQVDASLWARSECKLL